MANFILPVAGLATLGMALAVGMTQEPVTPDIDTSAAFQIDQGSGKVWLLSNRKTNEVCLITKNSQITAATFKIDIDPTCDNVISGSSDIRVWQQDKQGHVSLGDHKGDTVAEFVSQNRGVDGFFVLDSADFSLSPVL